MNIVENDNGRKCLLLCSSLACALSFSLWSDHIHRHLIVRLLPLSLSTSSLKAFLHFLIPSSLLLIWISLGLKVCNPPMFNILISYEIFSAMIFFKHMLNLLLIIDEPFIYWLNKLLRLFMIIIYTYYNNTRGWH